MSPFDYLTRAEPFDPRNTPYAGDAQAQPLNALARIFGQEETAVDPTRRYGSANALRGTPDAYWSEALMTPGQRTARNILASEPVQTVMNWANFAGPAMRAMPRPVLAPKGPQGIRPVSLMQRLQNVEPEAPQPERPLAPAVVYKGEVFTGLNHGDAYMKAGAKYPEFLESPELGDTEGFLTSKGRYVSRADAYDMAKTLGMEMRKLGNTKFLDSVDINKAHGIDPRLADYQKNGPREHPLAPVAEQRPNDGPLMSILKKYGLAD